MVVHARFSGAFSICFHHVGRHGQNREIDESVVLTDFDRGGFSIHFRHLHVHKDEVEAFLREHLQRDFAVFGHFDDKTRFGQELDSNLLVQRVVLGEQDARSLDGVQVDRCETVVVGLGGGRRNFSAEGADRRIEQNRWIHGLDESDFDTGLARFAESLFTSVCGDHHGVGHPLQVRAEHPSRGLDTVDAGRHLPVEESDLVAVVDIIRLGYRRQGLLTGRNCVDAEGHAREHLRDDFAGLTVVIHNQDSPVTHVGGRHENPFHRLTDSEPCCKPERASHPVFTLDSDFATHQLGKLL